MPVFVKSAGAAAVSCVEDSGVRNTASGSVCTHTTCTSWPHTPLLRPQLHAAIQRIHSEGNTFTIVQVQAQ